MKSLIAIVGAGLIGVGSTADVSTVEPTTRAFLDAVNASGGPPIQTLSPTDARAVLTGAQAGQVERMPADFEDRALPVGPTGTTKVRIVRPHHAGNTVLPAVVYLHGGGWVLGDASTHDRLIRELANGANAAVVFVEYDRSPEARFPVALEQGYATAKYIAEHGAEMRIDPAKIAVAGDSAGGNLAAAVTLLAKERGGPQLDFQVLFYPVTDANFDTGSYQQFAEKHFLTRDAMKWFWDCYVPDVADRSNPLAAPLQATVEQLRGLPPALVITAEHDVLRDEGEAYAHKLMQAGVPVSAVRVLGTMHDFVMLNALADTPGTRTAVGMASAMLRVAFAE